MMPIPELRVHGVSGTPPRDMLYTDPVESIAGREYPIESQRHVKVYRQTSPGDFGVDRHTRAFHWGGLTSGSWLTAFWVLMLPFSMANIAGWTARRRTHATNTWVRLFGLTLTAVFLNMVLTVSIDFYWQWADPPNRWVAAGVFLLIGWVWWGLVSLASTRSHFSSLDGPTRRRYLWSPNPEDMVPERGPQGDEAWTDPSDLSVTDRMVWEVHPILHRLRRIHFGFGYLVIAFAAATASDTGWEIQGWRYFDIPTGVVLVLVVSVVVAMVATGQGGVAPTWLRQLTGVLPVMGALMLLGAALLVGLFGVENVASGHWPHLRDTSVAILAVAIVTLIGVAIAAGRISAATLTLGTFFGVVIGAGAAFPLERLLDDRSERITGLDWLAISTLVWLLFIIAVALFIVSLRLDKDEPDLWRAIHDATGTSRGLFFWIPTTGLVAAVVTLGARCASVRGTGIVERCLQTGRLTDPPTWAQWAAIVTVALVWLATIHLLVRWQKNYLALLVLVIVPISVFLFRNRLATGTDVEVSLNGVVTAARTVAIAIPASFIVARLVAGLKGGTESRRGIGVIWDVVMFWPRWFHPLAPPAYGPHAVKRLRDEVSRRLVPYDGVNSRPLLLASHSQGTILSIVAVATLGEARPERNGFQLTRPDRLDRLAVLTYGCPLVHLYDAYFPSAGFRKLAECIAVELGARPSGPLSGRWSNLYRLTDPIGGPVLDRVDTLIPDPVYGRLPFDEKVEESPWSATRQWFWNKVLKKVGPLPPKPIYRGHSHYEPTEQFLEQRDRITSLL